MKKTLVASTLMAFVGIAMAGESLPNYPVPKVESTKTRAEVQAELAKWKADPAVQKQDKELYVSGN